MSNNDFVTFSHFFFLNKKYFLIQTKCDLLPTRICIISISNQTNKFGIFLVNVTYWYKISTFSLCTQINLPSQKCKTKFSFNNFSNSKLRTGDTHTHIIVVYNVFYSERKYINRSINFIYTNRYEKKKTYLIR